MTRQNEPSTPTKVGRRHGSNNVTGAAGRLSRASGWYARHHRFISCAFASGFLLAPSTAPPVKPQTRFHPHFTGPACVRIGPGQVCSAVNIITVPFFRSSVDLFPLHSRRSKLLELTRGQNMTAFAPSAPAASALRAARCCLKAAPNGPLRLFSTGHHTSAASWFSAQHPQAPGRCIVTGNDAPALSNAFTAADHCPAGMRQAGDMLQPV